MSGRKGTGGAPSHKDPNCPCGACTRRRQAEAVALAAGTGGSDLATQTPAQKALDADLPLIAQKHTPRTRIEEWLMLRTMDPDLNNTEAARRMGISRQHLQHCIHLAVKEGWLRFNAPIDRIEHEIVPKAINNLSELLDQKDRLATIETVKNTAFKQYLESKGVREAPTTVLALKIETAPSGSETLVMTGQIVGTPRELESKS